MTPIFPQLPVTLGTYKLTRLLGSHEDSDLYIAEQSHVDRLVVLEVMRPMRDAATQERFLENARARVATRLPHEAQVLESTQTKGYWHVTHELPKGRNLAALLAEGGSLTPMQAAMLIRNVAELYHACQTGNHAAEALSADMLFIPRDGDATALDPLIDGEAGDEEAQAELMRQVAQALAPAQPKQGSGRTRIATLISWMQDGFEGERLDWATIATTARQVIEQLDNATLKVAPPPTYDSGKAKRQVKKEQSRRQRSLGFAIIAAVTVLGMGAAGTLFGPDTTAYRSPMESGVVHCRIDGEANRMLARPVSIGDYRDFLQALETMTSKKVTRIDSGIPPEASQHEPDDWAAMLHAANIQADWNGRRLNLNAPVTNVSYWDALAYSRYAGGRLPEATTLQAVLKLKETRNEGIDEWSKTQNPAFGPYSAGYLVLPGNGGDAYPVAQPEERSPQRGFRILLPR